MSAKNGERRVIVPRLGAEAAVALRKRGNPVHDSRPNRQRTRKAAKDAAIRES
jgi:hypothetical protein